MESVLFRIIYRANNTESKTRFGLVGTSYGFFSKFSGLTGFIWFYAEFIKFNKF